MKCNVLIDYFTFSLKGESDPDIVIREWLGLDPVLFEDFFGAMTGYLDCKRYGNIFVSYNPNEKMMLRTAGVCVSMSGDGCRTFENHSSLGADRVDRQGMSSGAFPALIEKIHITEDASCTRVDLACDDFTGLLDIDTIREYAEDGSYNSRLRSVDLHHSKMGQEVTGDTIYFGSAKSDFRIRIYDKAKERGDLSRHWVRCEFVLRHENAQGFVDHFCNTSCLSDLASGIANDKFKFIELDDSNISRCSTAIWWSDFVDNLANVILFSREEIDHSIVQTKEWLDYQVSAALAMVYRAQGYFAVQELLQHGLNRLKPRHDAMIADYQHLRQLEHGRAAVC